MKDQSKCFVLTPDGYKEITYAKLREHRNNDPGYNDSHFFIQSGEMLMEVKEADCIDFEKSEQRQKYIKKESKRVDEVSLDALDTDEFTGKNIVADPSPKTDEIVLDKLMKELLRCCMDKLSGCDRKLLTEIFVNGKSERELAKELEIPRMTLSYRKNRALDRLRQIMKI